MKFEDAIKLLRQGKKIKMKGDDFFLEYSDDEIWVVGGINDRQPYYCYLSTLFDFDWEVVE